MIRQSISVHATKVVVRHILKRNIKAMYLYNGPHELVVDSQMTIQYINPTLEKLVQMAGLVKFVNNIATVILEYAPEKDNHGQKHYAIVATFTARTVESLVCEKMLPEEVAPEYFRKAQDDEPAICNKTKIYGKLDSELRKRIWEMTNLADGKNPLDDMVLSAMNNLMNLVDIALDRSQQDDNYIHLLTSPAEGIAQAIEIYTQIDESRNQAAPSVE